ncbi:Aste57867_12937 [Aphanomyces stellatus]|uniref:Aste57867_12937 protein n=1 Tax=Aphanomyces stellatus TaxID=120398 RepID=A0A485KWW8_9STRA|nr:hypothetical protein As57867_012889 [Aphanomyces stellatus]VFT89783.1 Aste57867_12937 [Aphanomyces stellatus]
MSEFLTMGDDNDDAQTTLLLRMRVQGTCVGYCLPTGEFLFATQGSPKYFFPTASEAAVLYGESLLSFLTPLDTQRLRQYVDDIQTQRHYADCGKDKASSRVDVPPVLATVASTHTTLLLDAVSPPLTLRLQRCIDAVQTADVSRRFSDESTFVIDDDDYQSVIANDALQFSPPDAHDDDVDRIDAAHSPRGGDGQTWHPVEERESGASLADFAFDFQEDWDRAVVELDELTTDFEYDDDATRATASPVATSQV